MSLDSRSDSIEPEYPHFQIYYDTWVNSFTKPADPLVLFYHWLLIHNRFKCLIDGQKSDYLPSKWNSSKEYYDFFYTKYSVNYRLEIYLIGNLLHINFKRLSDSMDTLQHVKILDYVDENEYKNPIYKNCFQSLQVFYKRIQWSIDMVKQKKESFSSRSSIASTTSFTSVKQLTQMQSLPKSTSIISNVSSLASSSYSEIITQIKQEKIDMDKELENLRHQQAIPRPSICSVSSTSSKETDKPKNKKSLSNTELTKPKVKEKTVLYEYNPIQKYYNYNYNVNRQMSIDQNNTKNDEFIRALFEKYNLKLCNVNVTDCMKTTMFQDLKIPIKLTTEIKSSLNLTKTSSIKDRRQSTNNKKNNKRKRSSCGASKSKNKNQNSLSFLNQDVKKQSEQNLSESVSSSYCTANSEPNTSATIEKVTAFNDSSTSLPEVDMTIKSPEKKKEFPTKKGKPIDLTKAFEDLNSISDQDDSTKTTVEPENKCDKSRNDLLEDPPAKRSKVCISPSRTYFMRSSPMKQKLDKLNEKLIDQNEKLNSPTKKTTKKDSNNEEEECSESLNEFETNKEKKTPKSGLKKQQTPGSSSSKKANSKTPTRNISILQMIQKNNEGLSPASEPKAKLIEDASKENQCPESEDEISSDAVENNLLYNLENYEPFPDDLTAEKIANDMKDFFKTNKAFSKTYVAKKLLNMNIQTFSYLLNNPKVWKVKSISNKDYHRYMILHTWLNDPQRVHKIL